MMLQALIAYAERRELESPGFCDPDLDWTDVAWEVSVSPTGKLAGVLPLSTRVGKWDTPARVKRPAADKNEISVRSLTKAKSYFLCDTAERILLFGEGGAHSQDPLAGARSGYFRKLLSLALADGAAPQLLQPLIAFLADSAQTENARQILAAQKAAPEENIRFSVAGEDLLQNRELVGWWRSQRSKGQKRPTRAISIISGVTVDRLDTTSEIKGIGKQDTLLVSANEAAFTSFGFEKAANSALSSSEDRKIKVALDSLVEKSRTQRLVINDVVYLHWTRNPEPDDLMELITSANQDGIAHLLQSVESGKPPVGLDENAYYCLGLSANGARLVVRDWIESTVPQVRHAVARWFRDLLLISPDGESSACDFKLWELLSTLVPQKAGGKPDWKKLPPQLATGIMFAAIRADPRSKSGPPIPQTALAAALSRQIVEVRRRGNKFEPKLNP